MAKARATNGKLLTRAKTEDGMLRMYTVSDRNGNYCERQVYLDEDGIDYVSLGGFFFDRLVLEETFGLDFGPWEKDPNYPF